jgi:hypothetical protein
MSGCTLAKLRRRSVCNGILSNVSGQDEAGGQPQDDRAKRWGRGRGPVALATAVALVGPVVLALYPSQLMLWLVWLFFVPLVVLALHVFKKADDLGGQSPEDSTAPRAEGVWWPSADL